MSLLQEATLDRLWSNYEHRFGHPPPITSATLDDAIALLRRELAAGDDAPDIPHPGAWRQDWSRGQGRGGSGAQAA